MRLLSKSKTACAWLCGMFTFLALVGLYFPAHNRYWTNADRIIVGCSAAVAVFYLLRTLLAERVQ